MVRTLYLSPAVTGAAEGGRLMLSRLIAHALADLLGEQLLIEHLPPALVADALSIAGALGGRIDGVTRDVERALIERIDAQRIEQLFLDGSNLGRLARLVNRARPEVKVITFFHNVEAHFFLGVLRQRPSARALAVMVANFVAEAMAVRYSDQRIALNARDSEGLKRLYRRGASDFLPMAIREPSAVRLGDSALSSV